MDCNNNYSIKKSKYVFSIWRNYIYEKQRYLRRFAELVQKTSYQRAFNEIKDISWVEKKKLVKQRKMKKIYNIFYFRRNQYYINRWKANTFHNVIQKTKSQGQTLYHEI